MTDRQALASIAKTMRKKHYDYSIVKRTDVLSDGIQWVVVVAMDTIWREKTKFAINTKTGTAYRQ